MNFLYPFIVTFELKHLFKSPSFLVSAVAVSVMVVAGMSQGNEIVQQQQQRIRELDTTQATLRPAAIARLDSIEQGTFTLKTPWQNPSTPWVVATRFGINHLWKSPYPLATFTIGQSDMFRADMPISISTTHWFASMANDGSMKNPVHSVLGQLDAAFVLVWLVPLWIILLLYDLVSAEREQGTLRMILAEAVSVRRVFAVKLLALWAAVLVVLVAACVLGGLVYAVRPDVPSLLIFAAVLAGYTLFWCVLALVVNLAGMSSSANVGSLVAAWLLLVVIVPLLVGIGAETAYPVPSRVELITALRSGMTKTDQRAAELLDKYYFDHPAQVPEDTARIMPAYMYSHVLTMQDAYFSAAPIVAHYQEQVHRQIGYTSRFAAFSPALVVQQALEELSGTSLRHYAAFHRFADAHTQEWFKRMMPLMFKDYRYTLVPNSFLCFPEPLK